MEQEEFPLSLSLSLSQMRRCHTISHAQESSPASFRSGGTRRRNLSLTCGRKYRRTKEPVPLAHVCEEERGHGRDGQPPSRAGGEEATASPTQLPKGKAAPTPSQHPHLTRAGATRAEKHARGSLSQNGYGKQDFFETSTEKET